MSETEIEEMFDVADTDRDGIIGYPEFMVRTKKKSYFGHNGKDHDHDNRQTMLNPPRIVEKPPRENRSLGIEQVL